jgi:hypothetical protein
MAILISYLQVSTSHFPIIYRRFHTPQRGMYWLAYRHDHRMGYVGPYDPDAWRFDVTMNVSRKCVYKSNRSPVYIYKFSEYLH